MFLRVFFFFCVQEILPGSDSFRSVENMHEFHGSNLVLTLLIY